MADNDAAIKALKMLNEQIAQMENQRDKIAKEFFRRHLSEQLIFRRVDGSVVGKGGTPEQKGFLESLDDPNPFTRRQPEDMKVTPLGPRALVTLMIRTKNDKGKENLYRNVRMFSQQGDNWILEFWYNYELTSL